MGKKNWEIAGIDANTGPLLNVAALGEAPKVRPARDIKRGDFLRDLMAEYGIGYELFCYKGVWTLRAKDTSIVATFTKDPDGPFRLLGPVELIRDYRDTLNEFPCEGANERIETWKIQQSTRRPGWRGYIGRRRRRQTLKNDGLRNDGEILRSARAQSRTEGKPGNFIGFNTDFNKNLFPGQRIKIKTLEHEIERIAPPDNEGRQMKVTAREVIALP